MLRLRIYFLWLIFYSFVGWTYETTLCSVSGRKFVNRGFLNGPYCPVYGFGALLDILFLRRIDNVFLLFLGGAVLTCSLEYFTSYIMEKLFSARWWDYSERKFNLNGRICLQGALVFGLLSVFLMKVLHPAVLNVTAMLSVRMLRILSSILFIIFLGDIIFTLKGMSHFRENLARIRENYAREKKLGSILAEKLPSGEELNLQQRRILRAYPKLKEDLNKIKAKVREWDREWENRD